MKLLDKILRDWRIRMALKELPDHVTHVLDVGCDDGFLLNSVPGPGIRKYGIDPRLAENRENNGAQLYKGFFPTDIDALQLARQYDAIFALAVLEHFSESALQEFAERCASLLIPQGRLIITVPHPLVDHILELLMSCRLVQAETLDEHHGFDPKTIPAIFQKTLKMARHKKFQLGLNNLFVFERIS